MWRACNFTPTHSFTGPVSESFASCLGVNGSLSGDAQIHNGTGFLLLAMSRYIGDPKVIDHWPHPRFGANNGKLHRHRANNVKSQL